MYLSKILEVLHYMHRALVWQGIVRETSGVLVLPDSKPVSHKTGLHILEALCPYKEQNTSLLLFLPSSCNCITLYYLCRAASGMSSRRSGARCGETSRMLAFSLGDRAEISPG